ncbi:hypothetical protein HanRHA438_Chr16g0776811 [Helianthus annuus]|nr:hypothetical protein HanRHA438_Chr16g0776811 [Helianthus annuus]
MLTLRQDYEIMTGGFGHGQAKSLSDGTVEKDVDIEDGVNCVETWVDALATLRARVEKALGDRLKEDPNNQAHQMLKRKYIKVLDVLPCFLVEGLEAFDNGEMLKRATRSTSSPPTSMRDPCGVAHGSDVDDALEGMRVVDDVGEIAADSRLWTTG